MKIKDSENIEKYMDIAREYKDNDDIDCSCSWNGPQNQWKNQDSLHYSIV